MSNIYNFRLAVPDDAPAFAKWVAENPQIDPTDIEAGLKKNNPSAVTFVVEKDGIPVVFAPCYCQMTLAHLGLNPEASASDKMRALEVLKNGAMAFAVQFGVREITTLTKSNYGVAKWAASHGFERDARELFRLDINKVIAEEQKELASVK